MPKQIAYFVDFGRVQVNDWFRKMMSWHQVAFVTCETGLKEETKSFLETLGVHTCTFKEGIKGAADLSEDDMRMLLQLHDKGAPGRGKLELLYHESAKGLAIHEIVLLRPHRNDRPSPKLSDVFTVAHLQSYGFTVFNEDRDEITHASMKPSEDIRILGEGDVEYHPETLRGEVRRVYEPVFLPMVGIRPQVHRPHPYSSPRAFANHLTQIEYSGRRSRK